MSADVASVVGVTFRCGWTRACAMSGFVGSDSRQTGDRSVVLGGERRWAMLEPEASGRLHLPCSANVDITTSCRSRAAIRIS